MRKLLVLLSVVSILLFGRWFITEDVLASNTGSAEEFFEKINSDTYQEFSQPTGNLRVIIKYKDIPDTLKNKGILKMVPKTSYSGDPKINPNAEIYYYASWKKQGDEFNFRYAVFDVNSTKILVSGSSYHLEKNGTK